MENPTQPDTNGNGHVSAEELRAITKRLRKAHRAIPEKALRNQRATENTPSSESSKTTH